jgi:outer membrane protein
MSVRKTASFWTAAVMATAMAAPAAAQQPSDAHVKELVQQALAQTQGAASQTPTTTQVPFTTVGPKLDLTIEEAVQRALEKNIDISVARITPRLTDFTIAGLEANYRLNLTSATSNNRNTQLPRQITQGFSEPTTQVQQNWSAGVAQNLWWGGGNYTLNWTNSRLNSPSATNFRNPQLSSGLTGSITQPLMRGFKIDSTRATLKTSRLSQQNDEISLDATTVTTQASVRNAYWDLVNAIQSVEAAQNSYDIAARLVKDNQARVEIGTLAPIDVVTAQSEEANRRLAVVQAQGNVRTTELALKRLIVSGTDDPVWTSSINPVDRPPTLPEPIDLEAAVKRALTQRTDLSQTKNNLKISDINLQSQVDATKPTLNLVSSLALNGLGGPFQQRSTPDPITGTTQLSTVPSGYVDALRNIYRFDAPNWTIGVNFSYPLGQSAQDATVARSRLSLRQTEANLKALELQIATEVTNAALTVQSSLESVQATSVARELAQKKLEAAQSKFEVGMATNFEVVQAQRDFADARNNELRATLNYRKALVNFDTVQRVGSRAVSSGVTGTGGTGTTGSSTGATGGTGGSGFTGGSGGGGGQ